MKRTLLLTSCMVLLAVLPALAQETTTGTVTGTVVDPTGTPLPGATVQVSGGGSSKQTFSGPKGQFRITGLRPGSYDVAVTLEGFADNSQTADVTAGGEAKLDFQLAIGTAEAITVTGSFIPSQVIEEGAAPIDVIDRSQFEDEGSPDYEELIRNIPQMYGHANQSNQFTFNSTHQGQRAVNLRGFGSQRNLVLINNARAMNGGYEGPQGPIVDVGAFPKIALKRIDILKEATPVYGSDAITGVFNYVTDSEFEGTTIDAWHNEIEGQRDNGDNYLGIMKGYHLGPLRIVSSLDYSERGELRQVDAKWFRERTGGLKDNSWPLGRSGFGNPGGFFGLGPNGATPFLDPDCGVTDEVTGADSFPLSAFQCGWYYVQFDNLIDSQWRLNVFNEFTADLDNGSQLYGHLLYSKMSYDFRTSPSYPPTAVKSGFPVPFSVFVPPNNPGLAKYIASLPPDKRVNYAGGALFFGRPRGIAGFGRDGGYANTGLREQEMYQFKGGNRGQWGVENPVHYDFYATYGTTRGLASGHDVVTDRWNAALNGFGGEDCDPETGTAGVAPCYYWNPFYEGYTTDDPALKNRYDVWQWMDGTSSSEIQIQQLRVDGNFSGATGLELGGGPLTWAAGFEYDRQASHLAATGFNREFSSLDDTPLIFLPLTQPFGDPSPFISYSRAAYTEFLFPFSDKFELTVAGRYTDVPWLDDSFTKGKASFRFTPVDQFIVRGSYSQGVLVPSPFVVGFRERELQLVPQFGEFIIIETPAARDTGGIGPEEANTWNLGFVWHPSRSWTVSVDRFDIAFSGPIIAESVNYVLANRPEQVIGQPGQLPQRIITKRYNGPDLDTTGFDFSVGGDFYTSSAGSFSFGVDGSLLDKFFFHGSALTESYDALGKSNTRNDQAPFELYAIPKLKYNAHLEWQKGRVAVSLVHHFTASYDTQYDPPFDTVDAFETQDLFLSYRLPGDQVVLKLSSLNITDQAPPLFNHELAYDVTAHNPLGRVIKIGFTFTR